MSSATAIWLFRDPSIVSSGQLQDENAKLSYRDNYTASSNISLEAQVILRVIRRFGNAISLDWLATLRPIGIQDVQSQQDTLTAQQAKSEATIRSLRSLREGSEKEQRETWDYLKRVLDEDRLSNRKLFP
jgi:hypothetical protein